MLAHVQCHHHLQTSQHTHFVACAWLATFTKRANSINIIFRISLVSEYTSLVPLRLNPWFLFLLFLCTFFLYLFFFFFFSNSFFLLLSLSLSVPNLSLFAFLQPSFYCLLLPQPFGVLSDVILPSDVLFCLLVHLLPFFFFHLSVSLASSG